MAGREHYWSFPDVLVRFRDKIFTLADVCRNMAQLPARANGEIRITRWRHRKGDTGGPCVLGDG